MKINAVITTSFVRLFPNSPLPDKALAIMDGALNERMSFQLALRTNDPVKIKVGAVENPDFTIRVRRVGLVPVLHHNTPVLSDPLDQDGLGHIPGFVPDPLLDDTTLLLPQNETHAFWFTITPKEDVTPGKYKVTATIVELDQDGNIAGREKKVAVQVNLHNVKIQPRTNFDVTHWFYVDNLITRYQTNGFDNRFWEITQKYVTNIVEHGQNVLYVPLFTPPLDTDKYPSQLLGVTKLKGDKYAFDWTNVSKYIKMAKKYGITTFEWCHLFSQWGCKNAIKIFEGNMLEEKPLWPNDTPATSDTYRNFLSQLLPELEAFLRKEKIVKNSLFHISDEPHGDEARKAYLDAKKMVLEIAPSLRFIDAVSQIEFGRERIIDVPVPSISTALDFYREQIESWCYYCCGPRGEFLNHLMDTPLAKIAMHGFLFYKWPFKGFLHWGYNYWSKSQSREQIDPYTVSDGTQWPGWAYGDTFLVYPGPDGPIDSIRWEVFAEAMQDYALLQTLNFDKADILINDIESFSKFPKNYEWRIAVRKKLLQRGSRQK